MPQTLTCTPPVANGIAPNPETLDLEAPNGEPRNSQYPLNSEPETLNPKPTEGASGPKFWELMCSDREGIKSPQLGRLLGYLGFRV